MIAAIIIGPLIYFFNAFFIGRLIKKRKLDVNSFLASIVGFVVFFDLIHILSIWVYAANASILTYFIIFGILQVILIILYVINWRFAYITLMVNWKKIVIFTVTFCLVLLICWLNFRNFNSEFGKNWILVVENYQLGLSTPINFSAENDVITNFSAFNIMNIVWINAFRILLRFDQITFCNWSWSIIAAMFIACLVTWTLNERYSIYRIIIHLLIFLLFCVLTLTFIESYAVTDSWILLLLLTYVLSMVKIEHSWNLKLFILTTLLMGFLAASSTSYFTVICVWIFSIYYVIRNKQNSINFGLFLSWPMLLAVFSFLSFFAFWLLSLMNAIYLIFAITIIIIFNKRGAPSWETKIATQIYNNSGKIVYTGLIILIATILIANFFIFQEMYHWKLSNIDYKNFLTFTYSYVWTININSTESVLSFNVAMYLIFVAITITYLVLRKTKNDKIKSFLKNDYGIKFEIVSCILFINPLLIHILKTSTFSYPLNTMDLNMLFVVPIFMTLLKTNANYKFESLENWEYNWY